MVGRLMGQRIEVSRAQNSIQLKDGSYPAGTYVVRLDQPYRNYAVDLLTPQRYPKDGEPPYDDVSWELPANYHLQAEPTADPAIRNAALTLLADPPQVAGHLTGTGAIYLLKDTGQESFLAARYRLANFEIQIAEHEFESGGEKFPAGSWILSDQPGLRNVVESAAKELGLDFTEVTTAPDVSHHPAPAARIGVWVPWADTDSIGWIRYSLDQRKVPYTYLRDEDIRAGNLRSKIDVLSTATSISNSRSRSKAFRKPGRPCRSRKRRRPPASALPPNPTTSPEASGTKGSRRFSASSTAAA